jgi:arylsulfatase A-like enzyme/tetratricopeptide (TPR) repeat protein
MAYRNVAAPRLGLFQNAAHTPSAHALGYVDAAAPRLSRFDFHSSFDHRICNAFRLRVTKNVQTPGRPKRPPLHWLAVVLSAIAALTSCDRTRQLLAPSRPPIILISIDTLRSDHLPAYGYRGVETPNLDALRADSILFTHAYSHCPLTLPSHTTMLTGKLPADNGVRDNIGFEVDPKIPTLAELLRKRGYATGAAVSAIVLRSETGISRGFDFWDDDIDVDTRFLSISRAQRSGEETRAIAERWIGQHEARPFFFFFHLYEPHTPYEPAEPFRSRYGATYDGEIATSDAIVGRFIAFLKAQGIYDRALILLVSDHGEGLGDHGEDEHGILLYREAIQVPLLVKLPSSERKATTVDRPVGLVDVFPTIAEAGGVEVAAKGTAGLSLLTSRVAAERTVYSETWYPRFHYGWSDLHSLVRGNDHYIHGPKPALFDLAADPREEVNRIAGDRRTYVSLRTAIEPLIRQAAAPSKIDSEQARKLAALGYIGSTVATTPGEMLPDPHEHIGTSTRIREGFRLFQAHKYEGALPIFQQLLRENPKMLDIWSIEARSLAEMGRMEEAVAAAREALRLSPGSSNLAIMIANFSMKLHRLDDAQRHAELALADDPGQAHHLLAQVWLERNDFARATAEANLSMGEKRDKVIALMMLGQIAKAEGHLEDALAHFDEALAVLRARHHSPVPDLDYLRGDTLARMGRAAEAEEALRRGIAEFPNDPQAYKNLILLYATEGKNEEATRLVFDLEKASPTPPSYVAISETLRTIGDRNGSRYWAVRGLHQFPSDRQLQALSRS